MTGLRFQTTAPLLLLLLLAACAKKTPVVDTTEPDLMDQICDIEERRDREGVTMGLMYVYRNTVMDEYHLRPGNPIDLLKRIEAREGVCREALLFQMVRSHSSWMKKRWPLIEKKLREEDHGRMVMYMQVQRTPGVDPLILRVLRRSKSPEVRERAAVAVNSIDQEAHAKELRKILAQEKDIDVLGELIMSLNLKKAPSLLPALLPIFEMDNEDIHYKTIVTLAQSDFEGKQALFERDLQHKSQRIRRTARDVMETLREKGSLEMTMNIALLDSQKVDKSQENRNQTFLASLANGNIDKALEALKNGADPNAKDNSGRSALFLAINDGTPALMKTLIEQGTKVNTEDFEGYTPLMRAVLAKRPEHIEVLLEHGADPHKKNYLGSSALMFAKRLGLSHIEELLNQGR